MNDFPSVHNCPWCGYEFTADGNLTGEEQPGPGDFSFCIRCFEAMRMNALGQWVKADQVPAGVRKLIEFAKQEIPKFKARRN